MVYAEKAGLDALFLPIYASSDRVFGLGGPSVRFRAIPLSSIGVCLCEGPEYKMFLQEFDCPVSYGTLRCRFVVAPFCVGDDSRLVSQSKRGPAGIARQQGPAAAFSDNDHQVHQAIRARTKFQGLSRKEISWMEMQRHTQEHC